MEILRTPEHRFRNLPDYDFEPHYLDIEPGLRMHYVDEGPRDAAPVLMLHGEPTWSYLYRHMIPRVAAAGHRVIAPDLIGFGKSDKFAGQGAYSYASHVRWMKSFLDALDLREITLFAQDWGSLIGLRLAAENEGRFARIVIGNGMLPTGEWRQMGRNWLSPAAFLSWRTFAAFSPWFPIGRIVAAGTGRVLSLAERAAYDAPFPDSRYTAGARAFPLLVPVTARDPATPANKAAWQVLSRWQKPFLTCFSHGDPIAGPFDRYLQTHIPGSQGMPHLRVQGGHFLQEDSPAEIAQAINGLIEKTPLRTSTSGGVLTLLPGPRSKRSNVGRS